VQLFERCGFNAEAQRTQRKRRENLERKAKEAYPAMPRENGGRVRY
jgi:hypothetical protein